VDKVETLSKGWQEVEQQWQKDWREDVGQNTWKVQKPVTRKHQHPTSVPEREELMKAVEDFTLLKGNVLVLNKEGRTLCAVFGGKGFRLEEAKAKAILKTMEDWKADPSARVPYAGPRKRSYDEANYVSF